MKRFLLASLALVISMGLFAQTSGTGIGVRIGTGFDFSAKFWIAESTAFQVDAGVESWDGLHADGSYLIHSWSWSVAQDQMKVYYGPGISLGMYNLSGNAWFNMGVRAPSGVGYYFHSIPLECFVEFTPGINLFGPNGAFNFDGGSWVHWSSFVGAHWYF